MSLRLDELWVRYGHIDALRGVGLDVPTGRGAVTALLGPSGCGKSTLLRAVAGLEPLTGGSVSFDGEDLARVPTHRRGFGVVFQDGQLFGGRTVGQNVAYGLRTRVGRERPSRDEIAARVAEVLELVDLAGFADRPVSELSGGQAQRVALARALAPRPRLVLLDEPLSALDRRLRRRLAADIADVLERSATPAILVTHDHEEAAYLADTIAVMDDGEIVQQATPARLWRTPATRRVAEFLGYETFLEARVVDGVAKTPLGEVALDSVPDGTVTLALRPESVVVSDDGVPAAIVRSAATPVGRVLTVGVGGITVAAVDARAESDRSVLVRLDSRSVGVVGASA